MSKPKITGAAACTICKGYGSIWTNWGGNRPVTCGHCWGSGRQSDREDLPSSLPGSRETTT